MEGSQPDTLSHKLDVIIKLMLLKMGEGKSQSEQIWLMSQASMQPKDIAELLGTTPNTVRVALSKLRKREK